MLKTHSVQVNAKLLTLVSDMMVIEKQYPIYNDGILMSVSLYKSYLEFEELKKQKDENRFKKYYGEFMTLVNRLQKLEMIDPNPRRIRSLEDINI